jgi:hypothetical protein
MLGPLDVPGTLRDLETGEVVARTRPVKPRARNNGKRPKLSPSSKL